MTGKMGGALTWPDNHFEAGHVVRVREPHITRSYDNINNFYRQITPQT